MRGHLHIYMPCLLAWLHLQLQGYNMSREQIVAEQAAASQGLAQAQLALARSQNAINDPITLAAVQAAYVAMQVCLCEGL